MEKKPPFFEIKYSLHAYHIACSQFPISLLSSISLISKCKKCTPSLYLIFAISNKICDAKTQKHTLQSLQLASPSQNLHYSSSLALNLTHKNKRCKDQTLTTIDFGNPLNLIHYYFIALCVYYASHFSYFVSTKDETRTLHLWITIMFITSKNAL
jgi:hypothetical protein